LLLNRAINDLTNQARDQVINFNYGESLPQVHALNCLRLIFTTATLGDRSESFVTAAFGLAGECLSSTTWAIRNCGLMLFRALFERLLGSSEQNDLPKGVESVMSRMSWAAIPGLENAMFELLDKPLTYIDAPAASLESVFPALNMLQKIPPPNDKRGKTLDMITRLLQSSHSHIRNMAARTYSALIQKENLMTIVIELLEGCKGLEDQNKVHGHLTCVQYLCNRLFDIQSKSPSGNFWEVERLQRKLMAYSDIYKSLIRTLLDYSGLFYNKNYCPATKSAYIDILGCILNQICNKEYDDGFGIFDLIQECNEFLVHEVSTYEYSSPAISLSISLSTCIVSLLCVRLSNGNSRQSIIISSSGNVNKILGDLLERDSSTFALLCDELLPLVPVISLEELRILKKELLSLSIDQMKAASVATVNLNVLLISILERDRDLPHIALDSSLSVAIEEVLMGDIVTPPSHVEVYIRLWSLLLPVLGESSIFSVPISTASARDYYIFLHYLRPFLRDISVRILVNR
jgi:Putative death-receptor fusion protein (DUF2428)